ncbi:MAG: cytochrome c oxidase subunit I [Gemmatimonadota bacterium]
MARQPEVAPGADGFVSPAASERAAQEARLGRAWAVPKGWRYWSEVNNTTVGIWYVVAAVGFFCVGGLLALLMRAQLAVPDNTLITADRYNQLFTMHGSVMMFLFAVPIFESVSILLLPQMLGARDLPFPRLSAYGFWCYVIGGVFFCSSLLFDAAPTGGWFMYPPLSGPEYDPGIGADMWLLGLGFIEVAAIAAAIELVIGVLRGRAPGMRLGMMPLYGWYSLVVGVMILFAFPPLIIGTLLLELERALGWAFFDPTRGGDPLLWQHLFWIFGHPDVYIMFLPAMALVAMIIPTFARTPAVGYEWIALSAAAIGFLSFGLWVHHMFTTGLPNVSLGLFSAASMAVAIPTGIQVFAFIATIAAGRVVRSVPMLFVLGGLATFVIGGITGVMVALVPFDLQAHDSYFIVAHMHYVLIGGVLLPTIGGIHYWFPLFRARLLSARLGRISFWLMFSGTHLTFMPMHLSGLMGMPRRVFTWPAGLGLELWNLLSSIGAAVLAAGVLVFLFDLLKPRRNAAPPSRNPWKAGTLEWATPIPMNSWGIRSLPVVNSRYPLWEQQGVDDEIEEARGLLADSPGSRREMLVTSTVGARPEQLLELPGVSFLPLAAAALTAAVFILVTFKSYTAAAVSAVAATAVIVTWLWRGTSLVPAEDRRDIGSGVIVPTRQQGSATVGWWAMFTMMSADAVAFGSILFGFFFLWTARPDFAAPVGNAPDVWWGAAAFVATLAVWALALFARAAHRVRRKRIALVSLCAATAAAALVILSLVMMVEAVDPAISSYGSVVWTLVVWTVAHVVAGILLLLYSVARVVAGRLHSAFDNDLAIACLYWQFTGATSLLTAVLVGATA